MFTKMCVFVQETSFTADETVTLTSTVRPAAAGSSHSPVHVVTVRRSPSDAFHDPSTGAASSRHRGISDRKQVTEVTDL